MTWKDINREWVKDDKKYIIWKRDRKLSQLINI